MAAPARRGRRGGTRDHLRSAPSDVRVSEQRLPEVRGPARVQASGHALPPLPDEDHGARPRRRQPHHLLVPRLPAMKRVGHKGADLVAPGNTVASFEAALEHDVDMIEFDVLRLRDGRLVLAHDYEDAGRREPLTLKEGLDHFAGDAYADVELDGD